MTCKDISNYSKIAETIVNYAETECKINKVVSLGT